MSTKPVIFTISAARDDEASVWTGHCDDIPAAADAPTLDGLLDKIAAMALDLLPDNNPDVDPQSLFMQITALREAVHKLNGATVRPRAPRMIAGRWLHDAASGTGLALPAAPPALKKTPRGP